jgi:uridine phosphorylase
MTTDRSPCEPDIPLLHADLDDEALIAPGAFAVLRAQITGQALPGPLPAMAVITFYRSVTDVALATWGAPDKSQLGLHEYHREGRHLVLAQVGIGASQAVTRLEELLARGVQCVVAVGTAGGLQPDLEPGQVVVVNRALRDEGTSFHYMKPSRDVVASPDAVDNLAAVLTAHGIPVRVGATWTTDAPYRETRGKLARFREEGVLLVDMEMSALLAAGRYRGATVVGALVVSDLLGNDSWEPRFLSERLEESQRQIFRALMGDTSALE